MRIKLKLDVLKPHRPGNFAVAKALYDMKGIDHVTINVDEIDQKTTSVFIKVEGTEIQIESVIEKLEELNCSLHSVDTVEIYDETKITNNT